MYDYAVYLYNCFGGWFLGRGDEKVYLFVQHYPWANIVKRKIIPKGPQEKKGRTFSEAHLQKIN